MEIPKYLKIHLEGGIGDCLKVLTVNFALLSLYKKHKCETVIAYGGPKVNDCGWGNILKNELIDQIEGFSYIDHKEFDELDCPTVQDFFKTDARQLLLQKLMPLKFKNKFHFPLSAHRRIAIQTDSNDKRKKYSIEKWEKLIQKILKKYKHTDLYIFDSPSRADYLDKHLSTTHNRVHNCSGIKLWESITLLQKMDLLIAPDSFSKYICLPSRVAAIILCAELHYMNTSDMLRTCFNGIHHNDNFKLIGLGAEPVSNINQIEVEEILSYV